MSVEHEGFIRRSFEVARSAVANGNHPFGAVFVLDGKIILEAENSVCINQDCTCHAELNLVKQVCKLPLESIQNGILYSSTEPCCMCSGAIFWSGIKNVVYGMSEHHLPTLVGPSDTLEKLIMSLPCRNVFKQGQRTINVVGPILEEEAIAVHGNYWREK